MTQPDTSDRGRVVVRSYARKSSLFGFEHFDNVMQKYQRLVEKGGWPTLPVALRLRVGQSDSRVSLLQERLALEGYLKEPQSSLAIYDEEIAAAVEEFQSTHGLIADGILGSRTITEMNVSATERLRQLEINRDRLASEQMPIPEAGRYVLVNIPDYRLHFIVDDRSKLDMKVIVGMRRAFPTPLFSQDMLYVVINPHWNVPMSIARTEMLAKLRKDPGSLSRQKIRIHQVTPQGIVAVSPHAVDWTSVNASSFPYRLSQDPGEQNVLGHFKFLFPNPHNVYLHDTNSRALFERESRDFSHGCIRIEKPVELAEQLLAGSEWNRDEIEEAIRNKGERVISLTEPVPVHIIYLTAWIDEDDTVQFREDLYGHDRRAK